MNTIDLKQFAGSLTDVEVPDNLAASINARLENKDWQPPVKSIASKTNLAGLIGGGFVAFCIQLVVLLAGEFGINLAASIFAGQYGWPIEITTTGIATIALAMSSLFYIIGISKLSQGW